MNDRLSGICDALCAHPMGHYYFGNFLAANLAAVPPFQNFCDAQLFEQRQSAVIFRKSQMI
ncbi:hypothetical protein T11_16779 [Trichinella zimbabwensis]|uniref:Uncharacterized protein n=1 Tax=Trichinella zimbabwensis TaxID=268475 RepID=A0A0V1GYP5_9BILA|nr:hypothetical protein T11_16779 [Trichinella zimbabwensis]